MQVFCSNASLWTHSSSAAGSLQPSPNSHSNAEVFVGSRNSGTTDIWSDRRLAWCALVTYKHSVCDLHFAYSDVLAQSHLGP